VTKDRSGCRPSVDSARRTARTPSGRPLSAKATATTTSLDCAPADSPAAATTTASARFRYRPTVPVPSLVPANRSSDTPAVASDGDLDVSRRTLAPGLVRRADATPCVFRATANWNRSSQLTVGQHSRREAPLRRISHLDSALSLSLLAHPVEPYLNSPNTCGGYTHCS